MAAPPTETTSSSATPTFVPQGKHAGKPSLPIGRAFTLVGARHRAHLHLLSSTVSKSHAIIVNDAGNLYIRDTASREHVYVNDQPVKETDLRHGDTVKIGSFSFRFVDMSGKSGRVIPDPAPQAALEMEGEALPILFEGRTILFGRRPNCDVIFKEESVSNVHAVIFEINGQHYIRDLGSRTGTFVNGEQIHNQPLAFNDVVRVGDKEMRFVRTGVPSNLDELEHLIGTSKLGAESLALASIDAARYTAAPAPAAPQHLTAPSITPAAPPPQRFTASPVPQAPQHLTAAAPIAPAAPAPQRFTSTPAAPQQRYSAAPAPAAPQRSTAAPAAAAPQRYTAAPAPAAPQRYIAAPATAAPQRYTTASQPSAGPQRYTAAPAARSQSTADLDKLDLDSDSDVSGPGDTKAIPLEGPDETSRTPILSSRVVDTADEIDLEDQRIPIAAAPSSAPAAPAAEEAELDFAFSAAELESAPVDPSDALADLLAEFAPHIEGAVPAITAPLMPDESAPHATAHEPPGESAPHATANESTGETETANDELDFAVDDHAWPVSSDEAGGGADAGNDELDFAEEDAAPSVTSHEPAAEIQTDDDELAFTANEHALSAAPDDSKIEIATANAELDFAVDDAVLPLMPAEFAGQTEPATDELNLAAATPASPDATDEGATEAEKGNDDLNFTSNKDVLSTNPADSKIEVDAANAELDFAIDDVELPQTPAESAGQPEPANDEFDSAPANLASPDPSDKNGTEADNVNDELNFAFDEHVLSADPAESGIDAETSNEGLEFAIDDVVLPQTPAESAGEAEPANDEWDLAVDDHGVLQTASHGANEANAIHDELSAAADDHISHGATLDRGSEAGTAKSELALATDELLSHDPNADAENVATTEHELHVTGVDSLLQPISDESATSAFVAQDDMALAVEDDIFRGAVAEFAESEWVAGEDDGLPMGVEPMEHSGVGVPTPAYADEEAARLLNLPLGAPIPPAFGAANTLVTEDATGTGTSPDEAPFPLISAGGSKPSDGFAPLAEGEVIAPTDPSPESAQQLESQLAPAPISVGEPVKVDELSDSTFGQAVQDFAGSALGSLVEQHEAGLSASDAGGDPVVDDALAFLAHAGLAGDDDFGLDFEALSAEVSPAPAAPQPHALTAAEALAPTEDLLDDEALGLDFANLAPQETTEPLSAERPAVSADAAISDDALLDDEAFALYFENLAPEEPSTALAPDHAVTANEWLVSDESAPAIEAPLDERPNESELAPLTPDELAPQDASAPPTPNVGDAVEHSSPTDPPAGVEMFSGLSFEELVSEETPPESNETEDGSADDLFDWDFGDLAEPSASITAPPAEWAPEPAVGDAQETDAQILNADELDFGVIETPEIAPIAGAELSSAAASEDPAAFDFMATAADGLAGFDDLDVFAAPQDQAARSASVDEAAAFTVSDDVDVSRAERADLFESPQTTAEPIETSEPTQAPLPAPPAQVAPGAEQPTPSLDAAAIPPDNGQSSTANRGSAPAPAIDPFFGMSRDFGSFLGGVPLALPAQSWVPAPPPPAPPRVVPPPMFGETPVSLAARHDDRSTSPPSPPQAPIAPPPPAPARHEPPAQAVVAAPIPVETPPVQAVEFRPEARAQLSPAEEAAVLPDEPPALTHEAWDDELPELADLAPDLFADESETPTKEAQPAAPAPNESAVAAQKWNLAPPAPIVEPMVQDEFTASNSSAPETIDETPAPATLPEPAAAIAPPSRPAAAAPAARPSAPKTPAPVAAKKPMASTASPAAGPAAPTAPLAKTPTAPVKSAALKSKVPAPQQPPVRKPPARAKLAARKSPAGLTSMGNPVLPSVDVFSQLPVDLAGGANIPQIARVGFVPPGSGGNRRPPGAGLRPPAPRKPGDTPPPARSGRAAPAPAKPAGRRPVIAEAMEDVAEDLPLPSEELLQQEPLELPPEHFAEQDKKAKKRWRFPFLKVVLLGVAAGGGAGAWFGLTPVSTLQAAMKFDGIQALDAGQRGNFARAQAHAMNTPEFRKSAQAIYETDFHGADNGFLSGDSEADALAYLAIIDGVRAQGDELLLHRDGAHDAQGDADRLRAMLKALYRADLAIAQEAAAKVAAHEAARLQLSQTTQRMDQVQKQLLDDQRKKADFDLAQLKEKDLSDRSAMSEKMAADASDVVAKLKSQVQAMTEAAAVAPHPVEEDAEVRRLSARVADLNAVLALAQPAPNGTPSNPAETMDVSLHQLQREVDEVSAVQASAKLQPYLGVVRKVESDIIATNAERAERLRVALQTLSDLERALAEKTAAHLESTWKMDAKLIQLDQDLAVERHRLGAAAGAGLTGEADRIRGRINELTQSIQARREQVAQVTPSTAEIKSLQKAFADQIDQMRADASRHDQRMAEQLKPLDQAAPVEGSIPAEQQPLLNRLTTKVAAVNTARELLAFSSATGAPDIKVLSAQVADAQGQLGARRKQLADEAERSKLAAAGALAKSQSALDSAERAQSKAAADAEAAKKDLAGADASLAAVQSAPGDLARDNAESATLADQIDKLKEGISRQSAVAVLTPMDPRAENLVQITTSPSHRGMIAAGCAALAAIVIGWIFAGAATGLKQSKDDRYSDPPAGEAGIPFPQRPAAA
ncbi:MAG TPA: FHA domain-containing protein [Tepidisphaeraceae bacterium]|jgi:pSer/pThr/pTyr-binding forkhead associated (FHA) protein|nr:FHA domain-containing protein [Tepidisphaeraceae bacterium]